MTLQEIREKKRQLGYTNEMMANLSGIPLSTVQKIMGNITKAPRKATLDALASVFPQDSTPAGSDQSSNALKQISSREKETFRYDFSPAPDSFVRETPGDYGARPVIHTMEEIYDLPEGTIAELMDGQIYVYL